MNIIIFSDLDGTIEDSRQDMAESINRVRLQFSLPERPIAELRTMVTQGMESLYRRGFPELLEANDSAMERIRKAYEADYHEFVCVHTRPYTGIMEAYEDLAKIGKVVVITNKPEAISRHLLDRLALTPFIADVMGGDSCPKTKPDALPLQIAAQRLFANDHKIRSFMVGDSNADMEVAKNYGATSIWCKWGYLSTTPHPEPDCVVEKPHEIVDAIKDILQSSVTGGPNIL